jgi:drug/metabolite transporter (DMT)-like permease
VAVIIGYFLGGEAIGLRTILGSLFVLISVVVITTTQAEKPIEAVTVKNTADTAA